MIDSRTAPYAAFVLRLALGSMAVAHALLKLLVFTLPGAANFFASLGLPPALAYLTFAVELVGGAMILLGVQTRWAALALLPFLLGATLAHLGKGWVFSAPGGGWEYPAFLAATAAALVLLGDGAWALRPSRSLAQR